MGRGVTMLKAMVRSQRKTRKSFIVWLDEMRL